MNLSPVNIAREHVTWALSQGMSLQQIIHSVGERIPYCDINREDAEAAVIKAYSKVRADLARWHRDAA
jgi:hypothetical protein